MHLLFDPLHIKVVIYDTACPPNDGISTCETLCCGISTNLLFSHQLVEGIITRGKKRTELVAICLAQRTRHNTAATGIKHVTPTWSHCRHIEVSKEMDSAAIVYEPVLDFLQSCPVFFFPFSPLTSCLRFKEIVSRDDFYMCYTMKGTARKQGETASVVFICCGMMYYLTSK